MSLSSHFNLTSWLNKIGHVVESLHIPDVYKDFDVDMNPEDDSLTISLFVYTSPNNNETNRFVNLKEERNADSYRMSYNSVVKETLSMIFLQMVSNLLLLVPLLIKGNMKNVAVEIY